MKYLSFLSDPFIATNIILVVLSIYIYILTKYKILGKDFFHFGPELLQKIQLNLLIKM